jgi:hypothetical protein
VDLSFRERFRISTNLVVLRIEVMFGNCNLETEGVKRTHMRLKEWLLSWEENKNANVTEVR